MSDIANKKLGYTVEADFDNVGNAIRELMGVFKTLNNSFKEVGDRFQQLSTAIKSDTKSMEKPVEQLNTNMVTGFKEVVGELKRVSTAFQTVRNNFSGGSSEISKSVQGINQAFKSTSQQLTEIRKQIRQHGMSDLEKQADNYTSSIKRSREEIEKLKKSLDDAKISDEERVRLADKLTQAQSNLNKLQNASKQYLAMQAKASSSKGIGFGEIDKNTVSTIGQVRAELERIQKINRQSGMSDWQKQADDYRVSIQRSLSQVEELKKSLKGANITTKERLQIQKQIASAEQDIAKLTQETEKHVQKLKQAEMQAAQVEKDRLKAAEGIKNMRTELSNAMASFGMVAGAISGALTLSIRGVMKEFGEFEHQMKVFQAVSQSTVEELEMVEAKVKEIGANTQFTATEVAAASVELSKMGFTAQEVAASLDGMVYASIASGESLADTSEIIATTIRTFGMAASDAEKVADIIARGANISGQSFASYAQSMKYLGSAASAANQDLVEVSGMLAILADRGLKFSVAGNGMQNALLRLQAPTAAGAEQLERFNIALTNTMGTADKADDTLRPMMDIILDLKKAFTERGINTVEQAGILKDLFGEVALNSMQVFMNTSNEVMDSVMKKQRDFAGSSKETADTISESFESGVKRMESAISALQISLGEQLAPTMSTLANAVQGAANAFEKMPKPIQSVGAHLALFLAGATAVFAGVGGIGFLLNQAISGFGSLNKMMGGKFLPVVSNVLTKAGSLMKWLVTGPVAQLILVFGSLYLAVKTNFGGMGDIFSDFSTALAELGINAGGVFESIGKMFSGFGQTMKGVFRLGAETLVSFLGMADQFTTSLLKAFGGISRMIRAIIDKDLDFFKAEAVNTMTNIKAAFDSFRFLDADTVRRQRELAMKKFFGDFSWDRENKLLAEATKKEIEKMKAKRATLKAQESLNAAIQTGDAYTSDGLDKESKKVKLLKDQLEIEEQKLDTQIQQLENDEKRQKLAQQDNHDHGGGMVSAKVTDGRTVQVAKWTQDLFRPEDREALDPDAFFASLRDGGKRKHRSFDAHAKVGANVYAPAGGVVQQAVTEAVGGSNAAVVIKHDDGTVVTYLHVNAAKKLAPGMRVEKKDVIGNLINLQRYGLGRAHAHLSAGNKPYAHDLDPQNFQLGGTGGAPAPGQSPADFAKQRSSIESQRYQLYLQHQQKLAAILPTIKKGTEQYAQAQQDLADATANVTKQEGVLLDLQLDAKEIRAKMVDDQLKNLKEAFEVLGDEQVKSLEGFGEKYDELKKKQEDSTKTIQEIQTAETIAQLTELLETAKLYEGILANLKAQIQAFKETNKTLTKDQQKELSGLEKQYADIDKMLKKASDAGVDYFNMSAIEGAQEDWEKMADSVLLAGKAKVEFFNNIQSNEDALRKLNEQVVDGSVNLEDLQLQYKLTGAEMNRLVELLAQAEFEQQFNKRIDDAREASKKAVEDFKNAVDAIQRGLSLVSDAIYSFGTESSSFFARTIDQVTQLGVGVANIFSGNPQGYFQVAESGFDIITSAMQRSREEATRLREEILNIAVARGQSQKVMLQRQLFEAQNRGAGPDEIKNINTQIIATDTQNAIKSMWAEFQSLVKFNSGYMQSQVDEGGFPVVFQEMLDQMNSNDPAARDSYKRFSQAFGLSEEMIQIFATRVEEIKLSNDQALKALADSSDTTENTSKSIEQRLKEQAEAAAEQRKRLEEYLSKDAADARFKADVDQFVSQFDSPEMQEAMRSIGEKFITQRNQITSEVWTAMYDGTMGSIVSIQAEITRRIAQELPELTKSIDEQMKKVNEAALKSLEDNAGKLKGIRKDLYDQQKKPIEDLIDAERRRLDQIDKQNKAIEEQIRLKNKERDSALAQFDAEDQGKFAALVAGVDYPAALRQGLDDIHNTEGVLTGTYSDQSYKEAIDERIALMTLENENRLKLEQQTRDEYLAQQQNIAALQARFAEEALRADDLTNRQRLELEQTKADAYVNFQRAYREAITERFESEASALQRSIDANNDHKAVIQSNIDQHQAKIDALTTTYDADLAIIDNRIKGIVDANNTWMLSVDDLRKGIEGPMNKIIRLYERAKELAASFGGVGQSTGSSNVANYGQAGATGTDGKTYRTTSELFAATKMATGGVVPPGFPNDTFPALLSSGESVMPQWFTDMLKNHQMVLGAGMYSAGPKTIHIELNGNFNEPGMVQREIQAALFQHDRNGDGGYNGAFQSSLN